MLKLKTVISKMKNLPDSDQSEEQSRKIGTMYPRDKFKRSNVCDWRPRSC